MKCSCCFLLALLLTGLALPARAQSVGVGTLTPNAKAALDIHSPNANTGLLIPRLSEWRRLAIAAPPQGLLVYQTDGSASGGPQTGFWYYAGSPTGWVYLSTTGVSYDPSAGLQVGTDAVGTAGPFVVGTATGTSPLPFSGAMVGARQATIFSRAELLAAGLRAGPITAVGFKVETKNSARPYNNFTVQIGPTTSTSFGSAFPTGLATVYSGVYSTTPGVNTLPFNAGTFVWDGSSNIAVSTCFDNSGSFNTFNDLVATTTTSLTTEISTTGASNGCAFAVGSRSTIRPVVYFTQAAGSYILPAEAGTAGQVLTQQANGSVAFESPQWKQSGTSLTPTVAGSHVGLGTSTPAASELLDVAGSLRATEVHTPTTGLNNMLAAAYGQAGGGSSTVFSSSSNFTFSRTGVGVYVISFTASSGLSQTSLSNFPFVATLFGGPGFVSFNAGVGSVTVFTYDTAGAPANRIFSFVLYRN
ncbi:hypothetical protein GCM10023185_09150 [Hymenobacter saemangeumensis]|uniref:Uncharacterized protein n=1 Tax=Hymenobacter saemangeumensis TaxID=1084522 RepID=A0ABP8I419_9BACT